MSEQQLEKRKGCNKSIIWFFVIAIACVAAFFIVGLVRTCDTDHEEKALQEQQQQEQVFDTPEQQ